MIHRVTIKGMTFSPIELDVSRGDWVIWINEDIVPHTVATLDGELQSGPIEKGEQWKYQVTKALAAEAPYFCTFHPMMKAKLSVHPGPVQ